MSKKKNQLKLFEVTTKKKSKRIEKKVQSNGVYRTPYPYSFMWNICVNYILAYTNKEQSETYRNTFRNNNPNKRKTFINKETIRKEKSFHIRGGWWVVYARNSSQYFTFIFIFNAENQVLNGIWNRRVCEREYVRVCE